MSEARTHDAPGERAQTREGGAAFPPAQFVLIYESRDGKLCLFEDSDGHLTAVRAEKLA